MYPYRIRTRFGLAWTFDTETNVTANLPPSSIVAIHRPCYETKHTGRVVVFQPIVSDGVVKLSDGEVVSLSELPLGKLIGVTHEGIPVFMGYPISVRNLGRKDLVTNVAVEVPGRGVLPITATVVLLVVISAALVTIAVVHGITEMERLRLERHKLDMAFQAQEVVKTEYVDVDTGRVSNQPFDGADVEVRAYGNGDVWYFALNERGKEYLDGHTCSQAREGFDYNKLLEIIGEEWLASVVKWVAVGAVAVGCVYLAVKLVPKLIVNRKGTV